MCGALMHSDSRHERMHEFIVVQLCSPCQENAFLLEVQRSLRVVILLLPDL